MKNKHSKHKTPTIIVTSSGGPVAENIIQNLKLAENIRIIGTDIDNNMLQLSSAAIKVKVHHASEATDMYVADINQLTKTYHSTMLIPVSDREIYVAALNRKRLPSMCLPHLRIVQICRNKATLHSFMLEHKFPVPQSIYPLSYRKYPNSIRDMKQQPMWLRATIGAGGWLAQKVDSLEDIKALLWFYRNKKRQFMLTKYLQGRNFCWTSLWVHGKLVCSVTKQRLEWVYNRIGTTSIQKTVYDPRVSKLCENTVKCLMDLYDSDMTALMMVDLKEDGQEVYVTEVNAGRTGTVSTYFTLASKLAYGDYRVNFHYQLYRAHHSLKLLPCKKRDSLPENMMYIRHIDMGSLLKWNGKQVRCPVYYKGVTE